MSDIKILEKNENIRPWGIFNNLISSSTCLTKIIKVRPQQKLSFQSHFHRSEHWVVLEGTATVVRESKTYTLTIGQYIDIKKEEKHSLQNLTNKELVILEIQFGELISESDIIRYEDMYGMV